MMLMLTIQPTLPIDLFSLKRTWVLTDDCEFYRKGLIKPHHSNQDDDNDYD